MKTGYLSIETHADHQGLVRFVLRNEAPNPRPLPNDAQTIRYIARFNDGEAALMHTHELLKRRLVDLDSRLYRVPPERAIAAVESLDLKHRRIYLDPDLAEETKAVASRLTEQYRRRRRLKDTIFRVIGYIAIVLLLLNLFFLQRVAEGRLQ